MGDREKARFRYKRAGYQQPRDGPFAPFVRSAACEFQRAARRAHRRKVEQSHAEQPQAQAEQQQPRPEKTEQWAAVAANTLLPAGDAPRTSEYSLDHTPTYTPVTVPSRLSLVKADPCNEL